VRIERAVLREMPLTLAEPFQSSAAVITNRRVVLLSLHAEGLEGWSECVALSAPTYTYETTDTAWQVLTELILPNVMGLDVSRPEEALTRAAEIRGHPMAKAAVEMAVWDLAARARGVPLAELLGGTRSTVPVGVSVGMMSTTEELGDHIARHLEDGYRRAKVKIAPGRDVEVMAALRERFPDLALWADANSAYSPSDSSLLKELDGLGLEMIEEPLPPGSFLDYARLGEQIETPICLDESIVTESDARLAAELGSCRVVNLKPGRVGGLATSRRIHDLLVGAGVAVWCGGMLESGVGRAHNVALASLPGFDLPGDISASRRYWKRDIVTPEFEVVAGEMAVPTGPGIGVEVDVERIEALTARTATFG
jgi:O-succinylbenzoate synthase